MKISKRLTKLEGRKPARPLTAIVDAERAALSQLSESDQERLRTTKPRIQLATSDPELWSRWDAALLAAQAGALVQISADWWDV